MMQAAFPGEAEDTKPDAQLPSYASQNIPAQPSAPGAQQSARIMPDGRVVYQHAQPMMVQGQIPGQMMYLPNAQPQQMWPSMQMPYVVRRLYNTLLVCQEWQPHACIMSLK